MKDEDIFELAETHGWQDDFGRWNFKDEELIAFVLDVQRVEREWVGLTEADIYEAMDDEDHFDFARAIEAKLKEKNT